MVSLREYLQFSAASRTRSSLRSFHRHVSALGHLRDANRLAVETLPSTIRSLSSVTVLTRLLEPVAEPLVGMCLVGRCDR